MKRQNRGVVSRTLDGLSTFGEALGLTVSNENREINKTLQLRKDAQCTILESKLYHDRLQQQVLDQTRAESEGEQKPTTKINFMSDMRDFNTNDEKQGPVPDFSLRRNKFFDSQKTRDDDQLILNKELNSPDFPDEHIVRDDMVSKRSRMNLYHTRDPNLRINP